MVSLLVLQLGIYPDLQDPLVQRGELENQEKPKPIVLRMVEMTDKYVTTQDIYEEELRQTCLTLAVSRANSIGATNRTYVLAEAEAYYNYVMEGPK